MSYGIKETKELLAFMIDFGEAMDKSLEDKKLSVVDAMNFAGVFMAMPAAFEGIGLVPKELKDMDDVERAELVKYVEEELDLASDKTEEKIEDALKLASSIYSFIQLFKKGE